ncbi:hypothetical protein EYC80_002991 [Monilinia laxa]|uniref:Uncharacterized protein n=1 Tax=Monilinia laxa TaxID=61186 RepID=A0A5N6KCA5_MONLA|nr:hypothetical protein EYC80_002991 [Monilinia laxa]
MEDLDLHLHALGDWSRVQSSGTHIDEYSNQRGTFDVVQNCICVTGFWMCCVVYCGKLSKRWCILLNNEITHCKFQKLLNPL